MIIKLWGFEVKKPAPIFLIAEDLRSFEDFHFRVNPMAKRAEGLCVNHFPAFINECDRQLSLLSKPSSFFSVEHHRRAVGTFNTFIGAGEWVKRLERIAN